VFVDGDLRSLLHGSWRGLRVEECGDVAVSNCPDSIDGVTKRSKTSTGATVKWYGGIEEDGGRLGRGWR
jgi:hypothetical protein